MPVHNGQVDRSGGLKRFVWPELQRVELSPNSALENTLSQTVIIGVEKAQITLLRNDAEEMAEFKTGVKIGDEVVRVCCSLKTLNQLVEKLLPEAKFPQNLSRETQILVMEYSFSEYIAMLEYNLGKKIELCSDFPEGRAEYAIDFSFKNAETQRIWLCCSNACIKLIEKSFTWQVSNHRANTIMDAALVLPIALYGPALQIPFGEFSKLDVGDAVLFPHDSRSAVARSITFQARPLAEVVLKNGKVCLSGNLAFTEDEGRASIMQKKEPETGIDQMPVTIQLELSRTQMSLGDLRNLTNGSIVPFDSPLPEKIRLLVGEKCFAEGQLMQVDENIAVRITKIE